MPQTRSDGVSWSPASSVPGTAPKADGLPGARILGPIRWRVGPQGHVRRWAKLQRLTAGLSNTADLAGLGECWMASSWGCGSLPRAYSRHGTPVPGVLPGGPLPWRLLQPTSWTKAAKLALLISPVPSAPLGSAEHVGGGEAVVERLGRSAFCGTVLLLGRQHLSPSHPRDMKNNMSRFYLVLYRDQVFAE